MKKYVKPMIVLERYELSCNIAACAWVVELANENSCHAYSGGSDSGMNGSLFTEALACTYQVSTETGSEDYCYQSGGGGNGFSIFQS